MPAMMSLRSGAFLMSAAIAFAPRAATMPADKCSALTQLARNAWPDSTTVITSATLRAAGVTPPSQPGAPPGPATPLPEHCEVTGHLHDRTGIDGQHYSIQFHMR